MDHDQRLFYSELVTVMLVFVLAVIDYDKVYLFFQECYISFYRFLAMIKFKVWLKKEGIVHRKK
jgi:hypothetical protein